MFLSDSFFRGTGRFIKKYDDTQNRQMNEICSRCGQRYGLHSGIKHRCPKITKTRMEFISNE